MGKLKSLALCLVTFLLGLSLVTNSMLMEHIDQANDEPDYYQAWFSVQNLAPVNVSVQWIVTVDGWSDYTVPVVVHVNETYHFSLQWPATGVNTTNAFLFCYSENGEVFYFANWYTLSDGEERETNII